MKALKLIKYGHEYCGPCKVMKPVLAEVAAELADVIDFVDRDTYSIDPKELVAANIKAVPTLILAKDGTEVWRHVGMIGKAPLIERINEFK